MKSNDQISRIGVVFIFVLGCLPTLFAQCDDLALAIASNPEPPFLLCAGGTITLTGEVSGGTAPYDWWWIDGSTTQSIVLALPHMGNLELTVTDANDCSVTAFIHVKAYVWTTEIVFSSSPICEGDSMGLYAWPDFPPGTDFLWSTGETTSSIFVTSSGTYSLTTTNPAGECSASATVGVTVSTIPSPTVNITGSDLLCGNETATLTAQGGPGDTYYWSTGAETASITISAPGLYWVQAISANGCAAFDSLQVTSGAPAPVLSGPSVLCPTEGATIAVSNAAAYTSFDWNTGQNTPSINITGPGTYTVTVTEAGGCTATNSIVVGADNTNLTVTGNVTQPSSGQNNGAINLTVSPPGIYTFVWSNGATSEDLTGLGEGSYSVTVSESGGCTAVSSFVLEAVGCNMSVFISVDVPSPGVVCVGDLVTVMANVTGGTAPYNFNWSNGMNTQTFSVEAPISETLVLTVTDNQGCTAFATFHIKVNVWTFDINYTSFAACQGDSVALIIATTASLPGTEYLWSTGETTPIIYLTSSGTYSATMTNTSVPCTASNTATVTFFPDPTPMPQIIGPSVLCPGQTTTLSVGGGPFSSYTWSTGDNQPTTQISDPGLYTLYVENAVGCLGIAELEILAGSISPELNDPLPICPGQTSVIEVSNASSFQTFDWSNGGNGPTITVSTPGTYTVTVTAAGGCMATASVEVLNNNTSFALAATPADNTSCTSANGSIDLTVSPSGSYTFLWSNGAASEDIQNLPAGDYTVSVTDASGCGSSATYSLGTTADSPVASLVPTDESCGQANGAISLSVSPPTGNSFLWSTGASTQNLQNLAAGDYAVTVTAANGCVSTSTATVANNNTSFALAATPADNTSCTSANGSIDLTVSPSGIYTFLWSNGAASEDIQNLPAGDYTVSVTDASGCGSSATYSLGTTADSPVASLVPTDESCGQANGAISLSVSPPTGNSFLWSTGASTQNLQNLAAGDYAVTVTAANGCVATSTATIANNNTSFALAATPADNTSCTSANGSINLTVSPSGIYTFLWSNGAASEDIQNLAAGDYTVSVTDASGCGSSATYSLGTTAASPVASLVPTDESCGQGNGAISLSVSPPTGNSFLWSTGASTQNLQNLPAGDYAVTVTAANGCVGTSTATVANNNTSFALAATPADNTSCTSANGSINLTVSPSGTYTFLWSNGAASEDIQNLAAGDYTVSVTDASGCGSSATYSLGTTAASPVASLVPTDESCGHANGAISLSVSPPTGNSFLWSTGASTQNLQNLPAGDYAVTVTAANGCVGTSTATIANNNTSFALAASPADNTSCTSANGSIDLTVSPSGTYTFLWSNGAASEDIQNLAAGDYTVSVTDASGCRDSFGITVAGPSLPQVMITGAANICQGQSAVFSASSGFVNYQWADGQNTASISATEAGTYSLTATDSQGCMATASHTLVVMPAPTPLITATATCDGTASLDAGTGYLSYLWSNGMATQNFTTMVAGSYHVLVTAANGCTGRDTLEINLLSPPQVQIVGSSALCQGDETMLAAAGNFSTYLWSTGATTADITISQGGLYTLTITDANGCVASDEWMVSTLSTSSSLVELSSCSV